MPSRYYTSLLPFRELFATGTPVLTYHHVGPRPHRARLKGLYVSPKLFSRQLDELKAHRFITPQYQDVLSHPSRARSVFFTFDDGFTDVFTNAMPLLNGRGYRAIEFLVAGLIGKTNEWQQRAGDVIEPLMDSGRLGEWLAAGHEIGAHTMTHPRLTQVP